MASDHSGSRPRTGGRLGTSAHGAWLRAYAAIWAITLGAAGLVTLVGPAAETTVRRLLGLTLTPDPNPAPDAWHILALAAHNIPIAAWPLLLGLRGAQASRNARRAANGLLLACVLANTIPVGAALGTYGTRLVPYIPQLPVEWAALAAGCASWAVQRERPQSVLQRLMWLGLIVALLSAAATLETIAVPHS